MSEIGPSDRPDLSQPPGGFTPAQPPAGHPSAAQSATGQSSAGPSAPPPQSPPAAAASSFDFNQPTIISLLYISAFVLGITGIVGVVLAYVWRDQPKADWEVSHYRYHIRTFWLWLIGCVVGLILTVVLVGLFVLLAVAVLVVVRSVLSLIKAQAHEPMPDPDTWLA